MMGWVNISTAPNIGYYGRHCSCAAKRRVRHSGRGLGIIRRFTVVVVVVATDNVAQLVDVVRGTTRAEGGRTTRAAGEETAM